MHGHMEKWAKNAVAPGIWDVPGSDKTAARHAVTAGVCKRPGCLPPASSASDGEAVKPRGRASYVTPLSPGPIAGGTAPH